MTLYTVGSGQPGTYTLNNGDTELVLAGGVALSSTVNNGGTLTVTFGGLSSKSTVNAGAVENVSSGGSAVSTTLAAAGGEDVFSGGLAVATQVQGAIVGVFGGTTMSSVLNSGGSEVLFSAGSIASTIQVNFSGHLILFSGAVSNTQINFGGSEGVSGGVSVSTVVNNGGSIVVANNLFGGIVSATSVLSGGEEIVASSGSFVAGTSLQVGAELDVGYLAFAGNTLAAVNAATDVLTVLEGGQSYTQVLSGSYGGDIFALSSDGVSGTLLTLDAVPCFCRGTLIRTYEGEVPVESLLIGDRVVTVAGSLEPITWIGTRSYAGRLLLGRRHLAPVRICAGALGDGLPRRDLRLSQLHALFLDGVLVPVGCLVNGTTIRRENFCQSVDYFHIELARHNVILAEGAPLETFLDDCSRGLFQNRPPTDGNGRMPESYAPKRESGFELESIRQRISVNAQQVDLAA